MELKVLYEDNHLVAVYKPAGVLVQGDSTGDRSLMDEVKTYLKDKYQKPGNVFLGLVQRLDRPVAGIVLFAKTSKGAARISEQIRNHQVKKIYTAVVEGKLKDKSRTLRSYLYKDEAKKKALFSDMPKEGYDEAELAYEVVSANQKYSLLKINLKTGRFHQIRAQLSSIGHAIAGDLKYGAVEALPDKSIALASTELTFQTATGDETKTISAPYPQWWCEKFDL